MKKSKLLLVASILAISKTSTAGIPVTDPLVLAQSILIEQHSLDQILKLKEQLDYLEVQGRTTNRFDWIKTQEIIDKLINISYSTSGLVDEFGSYDRYLARYQSEIQMKQSACFASQGCSKYELNKLNEELAETSSARTKMYNSSLKNVLRELESVRNDANILSNLQNNAYSAKGQMEALSFANQFASYQSSQLTQLRAITAEANQVIVSDIQAQQEKEAREKAASEKFRESRYVKSDSKGW